MKMLLKAVDSSFWSEVMLVGIGSPGTSSGSGRRLLSCFSFFEGLLFGHRNRRPHIEFVRIFSRFFKRFDAILKDLYRNSGIFRRLNSLFKVFSGFYAIFLQDVYRNSGIFRRLNSLFNVFSGFFRIFSRFYAILQDLYRNSGIFRRLNSLLKVFSRFFQDFFRIFSGFYAIFLQDVHRNSGIFQQLNYRLKIQVMNKLKKKKKKKCTWNDDVNPCKTAS